MESKYGFQYLRYSAVLADWLAKDPESKAQLQRVGWEVMAGGMQAELNRRLLAQIAPDGDVAIDGLRHPLDYQTLDSRFSPAFWLLFIDSHAQVRFERKKDKTKYSDFAKFQAADSHAVEQQVDSLRANAALVIQNEASLQALYAKIDEAIRSFRKAGQP